jgi:disulfide bond formation protein DsbB
MQREKLMLSIIGSLSLLAVIIALISQYQYDMAPCAWCVFQRLIYLTISVVCLALACTSPNRLKLSVSYALVLSLSLGGVASAWYQAQVASNSFSCAQTFADQVMTKTGLDAGMPWLFGIYASCMDARIKVFGLEYAYWSLILFALIALVSTVCLARLTRSK